MLYEKFIRLVEEKADQITNEWLREVKVNPSTEGYREIPDNVLSYRIHDVYKRLGKWLSVEAPNYHQSAEHFIRLGRERASEGIKASEVIYALILSRAVLWRFIQRQGIINNALDLQQAMEFNQKITNFFDKATYFVAVGVESKDLSEEKLFEEDGFFDKAVNSITRWLMK